MPSSTTVNPATGEDIATYTHHTDDELTQLIDAADNAFDKWRRESFETRANAIRTLGQLLRDNVDELSALMSQEMGKVSGQGPSEVELCAAICDYTANNGATMLADEDRELDGGRAIVTHQPVGVIYGIQPWNFPIYQVIRYSIPQIMAGNTVLLKHAQNVWGMAERLQELYEDAGLPKGVFTALKISHDQSDEVIANPKVRGVTLTGSDGAGRHVAAVAGKHLKKTVMELGSNDAYVVLSDADIERTVKTCVMGRIVNNGETCVAAKRFIVVDDVYEAFRDAFVERMAAVELADPTDPKAKLGPMARTELRDTLHDQVTESVDKGATLLLGGEVPDRPGAWYPATVLEDVAPGQPAYDDELFGPAAALIRVKDDAEAMRVANDSRYGLGGGIFSADVDRAIELARTEFDTGMVNINGYNLAKPNLPFGGVKDSGYGREHGGFGIREFVNTKAVMVVE